MKRLFCTFILSQILFYLSAMTTEYDLSHWPKGKSPIEIGNRVAEKFLQSPHSQFGQVKPEKPPTQITYPDVCTWLGGMWFANASKNVKLFHKFERRFLPLFSQEINLQPVPNHVDNNVFGAIPLELYIKTKQKKYLDLGLKYADSQWELPVAAIEEERVWADLGLSWQTRLWVDDMFMITTIQNQAYRATGNEKYIYRAAKEMVFYLDKIQLPNGLFFHAPDVPFCWGRGNGWMAVGMTEILRTLPKNNSDRFIIMDSYKKMMATLVQFQEVDGMWRQIIDDKESWKETSGSAMFTYSLITGVKNGWLDEKKYGTAARKGWLGLTNYINKNGELTEVCCGTNKKNKREYYLNRKRVIGDLHGQAAVLWCATALLGNRYNLLIIFKIICCSKPY